MIRTANDVKLKVLPVFTIAEHLYYYEGPCRFGTGESLEPGYDAMAAAQREKFVMDLLPTLLPANVELMPVARLHRTDDWDNHEAMWDAIEESVNNCDVVFAATGIPNDDLIIEFATRFKKPIIISPDSYAAYTTIPAAVRAMSGVQPEMFPCWRWEKVTEILASLRARKAIQRMNVLLVTRFGDTTSYSSGASFNSYEKITNKLGVHFRFINCHELFDQMTPAVEGGNPTTPGRKTLDLTDEDLAEANRITDELIAGAVDVSIDREMILKSVIAYVTVRKNMDDKDCCAFAAPCPDLCSTRRLNQMQFTFCLTHSLNLEQGCPSCCEFDVNSAVSMQALIAVSGKCPYMGNTEPLTMMDGFPIVLGGSAEQGKKLLELGTDNLYFMQHSTPHRRIHDEKADAPYAIRNFAIDQGFGATMRYNFDADQGRDITLCRFSPDGERMLISRAESVLGDGYEGINCGEVVYFRVKDVDRFFDVQTYFGNHLVMVYGDYVKQLEDLCKLLDVEPVVIDR